MQPAKFPLALYLVEHADGVAVDTHYYRDLFDRGTIQGWLRRYLEILDQAAQAVDAGGARR